jgi:hypothetical protein
MNSSGPKSSQRPHYSWDGGLLLLVGHNAMAAEAGPGQRRGGAHAGASRRAQDVSDDTAISNGRGNAM